MSLCQCCLAKRPQKISYCSDAAFKFDDRMSSSDLKHQQYKCDFQITQLLLFKIFNNIRIQEKKMTAFLLIISSIDYNSERPQARCIIMEGRK